MQCTTRDGAHFCNYRAGHAGQHHCPCGERFGTAANESDVGSARRFILAAYDGEPLFVIRGRDALAIPVLNAYRDECVRHELWGQNARVADHFARFREWQRRNAKLTHLPDPPPDEPV